MEDTKQDLDELLGEVSSDLAREVRLSPPAPSLEPGLPAPLEGLYRLCDGGDILFGELYTQRWLREVRTDPTFGPAWVPFGGRHDGDFWLCSLEPVDGLWFTSWDHEGGGEIGGPAFATLPDFLRECYESALRYRSGTNNVLVLQSIPREAFARVVMEVKKVSGVGTTEARSLLSSLPADLPVHNAFEAKGIMARLRTLGVGCHLRLDYF